MSVQEADCRAHKLQGSFRSVDERFAAADPTRDTSCLMEFAGRLGLLQAFIAFRSTLPGSRTPRQSPESRQTLWDGLHKRAYRLDCRAR